MKKRLMSLVLASLLAAALAIPAAAIDFEDVDADQYYTAAVAWAVEQGITSGTTETTFSPDASCTRGQILTFLWRAAGSPEPDSSTPLPFTDIAEGAHYYRPVLWALEQEILEARETLNPNAPCVRGEAVHYLWRYVGSPKPHKAAVFSDVPPEAEYAQAVSWAVETGITQGTADTVFSPDGPCTRGQIVTFLHRSLAEETAPSELRPIHTLSGAGPAYSLGLDGSSFTSGTAYEASFRTEIYSPTEAAFTIEAPFPLFQAWDYAVRFDEEDSGISYVFNYLRWDEAFADMVDWPEDQHDYYRLAEMTDAPQDFVLKALDAEDDRMGGTVSWRVVLPEESTFRFNRFGSYKITCEVSATPLPWASEVSDEEPPQSAVTEDPETPQSPEPAGETAR